MHVSLFSCSHVTTILTYFQVTIVGQGTGASCVMSLLASPQAKGLFHRTWIMSGGGVPTTNLGKAQDANAFILDATNCEDAKCLRNVS